MEELLLSDTKFTLVNDVR